MNKKIYLKKGNLSYRERKYIDAIKNAIVEKNLTDSDIPVSTNFKELEQTYNKYCIEDAQFIEIKNDDNMNNDFDLEMNENEDDNQIEDLGGGRKETKVSVETDEDDDWDDVSSNSDPFNREEPIVRDYVKGSDFPDDIKQVDNKNNFDEPRTQRDQMRIPGEDLDGGNESFGQPKNNQNNQNSQNNEKNNKKEPLNPKFEELSTAQKKKQTQRLAKSIVNLIVIGCEKGFEYVGTQGISEQEISELEMADAIDTDVEVQSFLNPGELITIKQFFEEQRINIKAIAKFEDEEKEELTEVLFDVLMEKGVAPSPMQNLVLTCVKILLPKLIALFAIKKQNKSILNQLIEMKEMMKKQFAQQNQTYNQSDNVTQEVELQN